MFWLLMVFAHLFYSRLELLDPLQHWLTIFSSMICHKNLQVAILSQVFLISLHSSLPLKSSPKYVQKLLPNLVDHTKTFLIHLFKMSSLKLIGFMFWWKNSDSKIESILAETTKLLDKMAPIKKLTKREANAKQVT